jgi:hypothetical protein
MNRRWVPNPPGDGHPSCCIPAPSSHRAPATAWAWMSRRQRGAKTALPDPVIRPASPGTQPPRASPTGGQLPLGHRLQVVAAKLQRVCSKARDYSRLGVAAKAGVPEDRRVARPAAGLTTRKRARRHGHRRDALADAFDPGVVAAQEERHVGAQRQADRFQRGQRQVRAPEPVERQQAAGRVGRAAAHAGLRRQALVEHDVRAGRAAGGHLQGAGGAQHQVVGRHRGADVFAAECAARRGSFEVQVSCQSSSTKTDCSRW